MKKFLVAALCIQATMTMIASEKTSELLAQEFAAKTKVLVTNFMGLEQAVTQKQYPVHKSTIELYLKAYQELDTHNKLKKNRPNKRQRERNMHRKCVYDRTKADYERLAQFKTWPISSTLFDEWLENI